MLTLHKNFDKSRKPDPDTFGTLARVRASIGDSQDITKLCPLCPFSTDQSDQFSQTDISSVENTGHEKQKFNKLLNHIASHLESIALLSLPEGDDVDVLVSNENEQARSQGYITDQDEEVFR